MELHRERRIAIMLRRRPGERGRERNARHRRRRVLRQRAVADTDRVRLAAGPGRQPDRYVAGSARVDRHDPGDVAVSNLAPRALHGPARHREEAARDHAVAQRVRRRAELQLDVERALAVMALRQCGEARGGTRVGHAAHRRAAYDRESVVGEGRVRAARGAADGAPVEREAVQGEQHRIVRSLVLRQRAAEHQLRRAAAPDKHSTGVEGPGDLENQIGAFVDHYNNRRNHESLANVTSADAYFGRDTAIIERRNRIKKLTIQHRR